MRLRASRILGAMTAAIACAGSEPPPPADLEASTVEKFLLPVENSPEDSAKFALSRDTPEPVPVYVINFGSTSHDPGVTEPSAEFERAFNEAGFDAPYGVAVVQVCGRGDGWVRCFHRTRTHESMWSEWKPSWP